MGIAGQGKSAQKSKARATELVYQYCQRSANHPGRSEMESRLHRLQTGQSLRLSVMQTTVIALKAKIKKAVKHNEQI